jgi:hypothetical protein
MEVVRVERIGGVCHVLPGWLEVYGEGVMERGPIEHAG